MSNRSFQHWFKLAFKLFVTTEWEKVSKVVEDGDVTYRWLRAQISVALKKIESEYFGKWIAGAVSNLNDRLTMLDSSTPDEEDFAKTAYWLKNSRGKVALSDSSLPVEQRLIGAKVALMEQAVVHFDDRAKTGSYFCEIMDALYDIEAIEAAVFEKGNPELAVKVKVVYDCAKEYAETMNLDIGDWTEIDFPPEALPKDGPPEYQPPDIWVFGNFGKVDGQLYYPNKLQIDAEGNFLVLDQNVVGEGVEQRLQLFNPKGKFIKVLLKRGDGKVFGMQDFCLNKDGNIVVCDSDSDDSARILIFDYDGNQLLSINISGGEPDPDKYHRILSICTDDDGLIYGADISDISVQVYNPDGKLKLKFGQWGRKDGEFLSLSTICVEAGRIYASDSQASRTQVFDGSGNLLSTFGSNLAPAQFLFDAANSQVYAVDHNNHKIEVYDLEGNKIKETQGGFGTGLENFWFPSSVALMSDGRLAVADRENHRIKVFKF